VPNLKALPHIGGEGRRRKKKKKKEKKRKIHIKSIAKLQSDVSAKL
jgi:hypothetical protein